MGKSEMFLQAFNTTNLPRPNSACGICLVKCLKVSRQPMGSVSRCILPAYPCTDVLTLVLLPLFLSGFLTWWW